MTSSATFSVFIGFLLIHLYANRATKLNWHGNFLSLAAGISLAYVFVDLLPTLEKGQPILKQVFDPIIPYLDRHAYVIALLGLLFFYVLQGSSEKNNRLFWASMAGYSLFNLFVGASLSDANNPDIQPLLLFGIAMGLHYFVHDYVLREAHKELYDRYGRWILAFALTLGWLIGFFLKIPDAIINLVVAFVAGGVLLNVMRYELPKREKGTYFHFMFGALVYSYVLLHLKV